MTDTYSAPAQEEKGRTRDEAEDLVYDLIQAVRDMEFDGRRSYREAYAAQREKVIAALVVSPAIPSADCGTDQDKTAATLEAISMWCTSERRKIRGRGGFDDQSEREIGIALVESELDRRAAALRAAVSTSQPSTDREPSLKAEIATEIYRAFERFGAQGDILSIVGSYGDTMSDADTLVHLRAWNKSGPPWRADLENAKDGGEVMIEHDGFEGGVIGHYVTREGKRGVVLQQTGTRVVHVYGEKWLTLTTSSRETSK